jgi:hypothetical protein
MPASTPTTSPDKVQQAQKVIEQAQKEIDDLTGQLDADPINAPAIKSGLQNLSDTIASVPTHGNK